MKTYWIITDDGQHFTVEAIDFIHAAKQARQRTDQPFTIKHVRNG